MKLWLDDKRNIPDGFHIWCKTAKQAIWAIQNYHIDHISLDNDLGDGRGEGYDVAKWIEENAFFNKIDPFTWDVHSANPVRRKDIISAMKNAEKYWKAGSLRLTEWG